jgi:O-antigen ligase/polysaccharide polymerase Wzy-like membrane protein
MSTAIALPGGSVRLRLLLVPLALLTVIVLLLGPAPEGVYPARTVWVLALAASSTLLVLNGPAWLLAPPLLVEFAADDYFVPGLGVSGRLAAVVGVTLLLLPALVRRELRWGEPLYRVLLPALAFLVLATLGNLIHSNDEYVVKYLRYQTAQLLMLVVAALAPRGRHDLLAVSGLFVGLATLASIGARTWVDETGRATGFGTSPVLLANQLAFVLLPLVGVLATGTFTRSRLQRPLLLATLAIGYGTYASQTRSALVAVAAGLIVIGLALPGRPRTAILGLVGATSVVFFALQSIGLVEARFFDDTNAEAAQSAAAHNAVEQAGFAIALDNPVFGIGHEQFEQVAPDYANEISADARAGATALGIDRPHDDFLSVWLSWGFSALASYVWLFLAAGLNFLAAARSRDPLIRGLAIGSVGGLVAYAVGSTFHNYLDSSVVLWVYAGLSAALVRIGKQPMLIPVRARRQNPRDLARVLIRQRAFRQLRPTSH